MGGGAIWGMLGGTGGGMGIWPPMEPCMTIIDIDGGPEALEDTGPRDRPLEPMEFL